MVRISSTITPIANLTSPNFGGSSGAAVALYVPPEAN